MGMLYFSSSQTYEQQNIQPFLIDSLNTPFWEELLSGIHFYYAGSEISVATHGVSGVIEFFIRKGAHFSVFFLLGFFTIGVLRSFYTKGKSSMFLSLLFVFLYACLDEYHQKLTGGRTPLWEDVMIDSVGGLCGILFFFFLLRYSSRKPRS